MGRSPCAWSCSNIEQVTAMMEILLKVPGAVFPQAGAGGVNSYLIFKTMSQQHLGWRGFFVTERFHPLDTNVAICHPVLICDFLLLVCDVCPKHELIYIVTKSSGDHLAAFALWL